MTATALHEEQQVPSEQTSKTAFARMDRPEAYYDVARKDYWIRNNREDWITVTETSLRRHLRALGFASNARDGERISDLEQCLNTVQLNFDVAYAGPLAGYQKGITEICGQRILVTSSPKLIKPEPGDFPVLQEFLQNLFQDEQLFYVKGWIKVGYESLRDGHRRPGQVLVIAGERDCGKSLFQNLLTEIFGGRAAKPYRYMRGATEFNGDLFGAEHLMIEDEIASTDIRARINFGTRIKEFTVNKVQSCHAKNRNAVSLEPFWRLSVSLNEEPENLLILPPFDDSVADKIILLRASKAELPMPTFTDDERTRFWATLRSELPAFLSHLTEWTIPEELKSARFGVRHFHDPVLLEALEELAPEMKLLRLIDAVFKEGSLQPPVFEGTAEDLQRILLHSLHEYEVKNLLHWSHAAGTYLSRLAMKHPKRVICMRSNTKRGWRITAPAELTPTLSDPVTPPNGSLSAFTCGWAAPPGTLGDAVTPDLELHTHHNGVPFYIHLLRSPKGDKHGVTASRGGNPRTKAGPILAIRRIRESPIAISPPRRFTKSPSRHFEK